MWGKGKVLFKMNKKGQADFIGNLLSTIPKPVLFLFFILLMAGIVALLSPVFNSFGIFCDSDGVVVSVPDANIITNFRLISSLPDADEIGGNSLDPNGLVTKCTQYHDGKSRFTDWGCSDCTHIEDLVSNIDTQADVCEGDAYRTPNANLSWIKRKFICPLDSCLIPEGYYYDVDTGFYECIGDCSSQTLAESRDKKLSELGAFPYYSEAVDDNSYSGLLMFGCSDNLKVQPTIKGVPIFDLKIWAVMILIILLLWGIMKFGKK